ncbi:MAG TPA: hypothetical protein VL742_17590 [Casimicrobiaceae bacterium]|nr:hypothetical protein [Casimicrobiaceae bacterium]
MTQALAIALLLVALSLGASAQPQAAKAPSAEPLPDAVSNVLDLANQNRPSVVAAAPKPASTLDDYTQERWRIKLQTIVPYALVATPVILLIVLFALRFGGVRSPEHIMLAAALVLVIQATLTVSLTAEGSDALSASMGILGAIAGYLFGRSRPDAQPAESATRREPPVIARTEGVDNVVDRRAA